MQKIFHVYILECNDGSYYTGITKDVEYRFEQHQQGYDPGCYTYNRRPLKLVFAQDFDDPTTAIMSEKQIKGWSRAKKKALIENDIELLKKLSNVNNTKKII